MENIFGTLMAILCFIAVVLVSCMALVGGVATLAILLFLVFVKQSIVAGFILGWIIGCILFW